MFPSFPPTNMFYISKTVSWDGYHEETILKTFDTEGEAIAYLRKLFDAKLKQNKSKTISISLEETNKYMTFKEPCRTVEFRAMKVR